MNQSIVEYFKSIGMGKVLIDRASAIHDQYVAITEGTVQDALVSEYVTEDGQRQYSTVLFFTSTDVYEVENFLSDTPTMWLAKLTNNLASLGLTPKEYDFTTASPASRLNLNCRWIQGTSFVLHVQASGNNCKQLLEVVRKYLMPNVV